VPKVNYITMVEDALSSFSPRIATENLGADLLRCASLY
jgi:hypothetical protein